MNSIFGNNAFGGGMGGSSGMARTLADFFTIFIEFISILGFSFKGITGNAE